jgi:hypothetical protein
MRLASLGRLLIPRRGVEEYALNLTWEMRRVKFCFPFLGIYGM